MKQFNLLHLILNIMLIRNSSIKIDEETEDVDSVLNNAVPENLIKLSISDIEMKELPQKIFDFNHIEDLKLNVYGLQNLTDEFFKSFNSLKSLEPKICQCFEINNIKDLLKKLKSFKNLKSLSLRIANKNFIFDCDDDIDEFQNLEYLKLCGYFSKSQNFNWIFKTFKNIKTLDVFSFDMCEHSNEFLAEISKNLSNLEEIRLSNFKLNLSDKFFGLWNKWKVNESIKKIALTKNGLVEISDNFFASIPNLEDLQIIRNFLTDLPVDNLKNLKYLKISENIQKNSEGEQSCIFDGKFLKKCFQKIPSLEKLDLSFNFLKRLPNDLFDTISPNLKWIDLSYNIFEYLPFIPTSVSDQIQLLNLKSIYKTFERRISNKTPRNALCAEELHEIFKNRLLPPLMTDMDPNLVYNDLNEKKGLKWNFSYFKNTKTDSIATDSKVEIEINHLCNQIQSNSILQDDIKKIFVNLLNHKNQSNQVLLYIKGIVEHSSKNTNEFANEFIENTRNSCLGKIQHQLRMLYFKILTSNAITDEINDKTIDDFICYMKELCLDKTVTPPLLNHNFLVFKYWKNKLNNHLGFEYDESMDCDEYLSIDPYLGKEGCVLDNFYRLFTPQYIIDSLFNALKSNEEAKNKIHTEIKNDKTIKNKFKETLEKDEFTSKHIKYYLLIKKIICGDPKIYEPVDEDEYFECNEPQNSDDEYFECNEPQTLDGTIEIIDKNNIQNICQLESVKNEKYLFSAMFVIIPVALLLIIAIFSLIYLKLK